MISINPKSKIQNPKSKEEVYIVHMPMPGLPEFDYIKPASLAEASRFLAEHAGQARPFLGGTDTFVRMRDGFWKEKYIVDIKNLDGLNAISFEPDSGLTIGASVNMNQVIASPVVNEHYPVLAEAAHTVASYQVRTRATIVGNICNASPAGDTIGACLVLDGILHVHGVDGTREEPLNTFFVSLFTFTAIMEAVSCSAVLNILGKIGPSPAKVLGFTP